MGLPTLHEINSKLVVVLPGFTILTTDLVLGTCLGVFASLVTFWRLYYRWRDHKLWWDDAWALFAMINAWILVACVWVIFAPEGNCLPFLD